MRNRNKLSPRQKEILILIAGGYENRDIAELLGISTSAIQAHVCYIIFKLGANNRTQAVVNALHNGVVTFDEVEKLRESV